MGVPLLYLQALTLLFDLSDDAGPDCTATGAGSPTYDRRLAGAQHGDAAGN